MGKQKKKGKRNGKTPADKAEALLAQGTVYLLIEDGSAVALEKLNRAAEGFRRALGKEHERVSVALYYAGKALNDLRRPDEALLKLQASLDIKVTALGTNAHADMASVLSSMARSRRYQGRLDGALTLYKRAIDMFEALDLLESEEAADAHWMGATYVSRDEPHEALAVLGQSLALKDSKAVYGSKPHLKTADTLSLLGCQGGSVPRNVPRTVPHVPMFRFRQNGVDRINPLFFASSVQLDMGGLHKRLGRPREALVFHRRAAATVRACSLAQTGSSQLPMYATTLTNLGHALSDVGDESGSTAAHTEAHQILRDHHETDLHPAVLHAAADLAGCHRSEGRAEEALRMSREILERALLMHGLVAHPDVASSLVHLASKHLHAHCGAEAVPLLQQAAAMYAVLPPPDPGGGHQPDEADAHADLCVAYTQVGNMDASVAAGEKAVALYEALYPSGHNVALLDKVFRLGVVYRRLELRGPGYLDKALASFRRVVAVRRTLNGGADPPDHRVARSLGNIAGILRGQGKIDEAAAVHARMVSVDDAMGMGLALARNVRSYSARGDAAFATAAELEAEGELGAALVEFEDCLRLRILGLFGSSVHKDVAQVLHRIARNCALRRQFGKAGKSFKRLVQVHIELFGTKDNLANAEIYVEMATVYEDAGDVATALALLLKAVDIKDRVLVGPGDKQATARAMLAVAVQQAALPAPVSKDMPEAARAKAARAKAARAKAARAAVRAHEILAVALPADDGELLRARAIRDELAGNAGAVATFVRNGGQGIDLLPDNAFALTA